MIVAAVVINGNHEDGIAGTNGQTEHGGSDHEVSRGQIILDKSIEFAKSAVDVSKQAAYTVVNPNKFRLKTYRKRFGDEDCHSVVARSFWHSHIRPKVGQRELNKYIETGTMPKRHKYQRLVLAAMRCTECCKTQQNLSPPHTMMVVMRKRFKCHCGAQAHYSEFHLENYVFVIGEGIDKYVGHHAELEALIEQQEDGQEDGGEEEDGEEEDEEEEDIQEKI